VIDERSDEDDELNQTNANIKDRLNETLGNIGSMTSKNHNAGGEGTTTTVNENNANLIMSPNF
jgi:hypothetical protein